MVKYLPVIWSDIAQNDLKNIYDFYAEKSITAAQKMINKITKASHQITFENQFQEDEVLGAPYRRAIVKYYKIIYIEKNDKINILRVFDTRQNPNKLKLK